MFVPGKGWISGLIGWTQVKYSCTIGWAVLYCYISLEVLMPYWNLEHTTQNHGKKLEGGSGQTEMTVESTTGFLTVAMTK